MAVEYSVTGLPEGLEFDPATRRVTGKPTGISDPNAGFTFTYKAVDDFGRTDSIPITVTTFISSITLPAQEDIVVNYSQPSPDRTHTLTLPSVLNSPPIAEITNLPAWARFDSARLQLTILETFSEQTLEFNYRVTDAASLVAEEKFNVTTRPDTRKVYNLDDIEVGRGQTVMMTLTDYGQDFIHEVTTSPELDWITFDQTTKVLSIDMPADFDESVAITLTYKITDLTGESRTITAMVGARIHLPAMFSNQSSDIDIPLSFVLPEATGGIGAKTYTVTGLPAGLTFDPASRTVSGTPTAAGSFMITYSVADADGFTDILSFDIDIGEQRFTLVDPDDISITLGDQPHTVTLPEAGDVVTTDAITYAVVGLPSGASFNASTRVLSVTGITTVGDPIDLTYEATDGTYTITRTFTLTLAYSFTLPEVDDLQYLISALPTTTTLPAVENLVTTDAITYKLAGLPSWAIFNPTTRVLSIPARGGVTAPVELTYSATIGSYSVSQALNFSVVNPFTLAPINDITTESPGTVTLPEVENVVGSPSVVYSVAGLPNGITFDPATRVLTLATGTTASAVEITYTATAGSFSLSQSFDLTATIGVTFTLPTTNPIEVQSPTTVTLPEASDVTAVDPITYSLAGLPTGATFDSATRVITFPRGTQGSSTLRYTLTDGGYTITRSIRLVVTLTPTFTLAEIPDMDVMSPTTITLPAAQNIMTADTITYSLGLSGTTIGYGFDPNTRVITIPRGSRTSGSTFSYRASDGIFSITREFRIVVTTVPTFVLPEIADVRYLLTDLPTSFTLPAATGVQSGETVTYSLTGLPSGVTFNPTTRLVSVAATTQRSFDTLTYTATDSDGSYSVDREFKLFRGDIEVLTFDVSDVNIVDRSQAQGTVNLASSLTIPSRVGGGTVDRIYVGRSTRIRRPYQQPYTCLLYTSPSPRDS